MFPSHAEWFSPVVVEEETLRNLMKNEVEKRWLHTSIFNGFSLTLSGFFCKTRARFFIYLSIARVRCVGWTNRKKASGVGFEDVKNQVSFVLWRDLRRLGSDFVPILQCQLGVKVVISSFLRKVKSANIDVGNLFTQGRPPTLVTRHYWLPTGLALSQSPCVRSTPR